MEKVFSYYRVSSKKQEENGASLEAQQKDNDRFAKANNLSIVKEFKEVHSASKASKRPEFNLMLKELSKRRDVTGIIFHDVDRGARSFSDWGRINELVDGGYKIFLSRSNTTLNSRGSRLTADVQMVMATDYIRNMTQEIKKGQFEKIQQGLMVVGMPPIGYINTEKAGVKKVDPVRGPLIREAFQLYATGKYSLKTLAEIMYQKGLRNLSDKKIEGSKFGYILNNKTYLGIILYKGHAYTGKHEPLTTPKTFEKVKQILSGKFTPCKNQTKYLFPHIILCGYCGHRLRDMTAKKKYHYYYCRHCRKTNVPEKTVEKQILDQVNKIKFDSDQVNEMIKIARALKTSDKLALDEKKQNYELNISKTKAQLDKLIEMNLEGNITEDIFKQKNEKLILKIRDLEDQLKQVDAPDDDGMERVERLAKLLADPLEAYRVANSENKPKLIEKMMSSIKFVDKKLQFEWQTPFHLLVEIKKTPFDEGVLHCALVRSRT